jgi:hypothetical protein
VVTKYTPTFEAIDLAFTRGIPLACRVTTHSKGTIPLTASMIEWGPGKIPVDLAVRRLEEAAAARSQKRWQPSTPILCNAM